MAVGERHAVAGDDAAIGVLAEDAARAAGREDHGARGDRGELAGRGRQHGRALDAPVVDEEIDAEGLVEPLDRRILGRCLEERVQNVEAAAVGGEPGPFDLHAAEGAHVDVAVRLAAPRAAPMLELDHLGRAAADEELDDVLLAEPVAAVHRVVEVVVERIVRLDHARRPAFRRDRVAAHGQDFRDESDRQRRVRLGGGDGGTQARSARPYDEDIGIETIHRGELPLDVAPSRARRKSVRAGSRGQHREGSRAAPWDELTPGQSASAAARATPPRVTRTRLGWDARPHPPLVSCSMRLMMTRRARDVLLDILRDEGVTHIFGNPGSTEMPLMDALVDAPDLAYVLGLQEATAVGDGRRLGAGLRPRRLRQPARDGRPRQRHGRARRLEGERDAARRDRRPAGHAPSDDRAVAVGRSRRPRLSGVQMGEGGSPRRRRRPGAAARLRHRPHAALRTGVPVAADGRARPGGRGP